MDPAASSGYVTETIYGTHEDTHVVMSEKVQSLAGSIYKEFERMIARYDEDVVKTLMPLLVNVLECLDSAYQTNQEHEVELELLREDNEQLVTQYEREKAARKHAEQRLLEAEDHADGERKDLTSQLEALENIVRMLELKHKNSLDHASRLEERENDLKKEYAKLHDRYSELFKNHVDYMERTKLLLSTTGDRTEVRGRLGLNPMNRSSGPISFGFASLEGAVSVVEQSESIPGSPVSVSDSPPSPTFGSELAAMHTIDRDLNTDNNRLNNQATSSAVPPNSTGKSQTKREQRSGNLLYQELSFQETDANVNETEENTDITGSWVHPGEYASSVNDNYFGMGKEVENLIQENNELLATKNALNVVKDDLIVKVDELTGEQEILREKVATLSATRQELRMRVQQLEDELRNLKEQMSNNASGGAGETEEEADVPMAQRKRFTRVEMARVLMERNQYKERFMELQDAVRWTEMMRASRVDSGMDKKSKQSIWSFFSKLFSTGAGERPQRPLSTPHLRAVTAPGPAMRHSRTQADFLETQLTEHHHRRNIERNEQFRQVRAHVRKEDGRTQAYGWSLPSKSNPAAKGPSPSASLSSTGVPVPVPVFCRPIAENEPKMTLLCAAGVNLNGGRTPDGGCMVGESVFYAREEGQPVSLADEMESAQASPHSPEVELISRQIESTHSPNTSEKNLSSLVWICASTPTHGLVMIIDANFPADIKESFTMSDKHVLCVASVPGATAEDYAEYEERMANEHHQQDADEIARGLLSQQNNNGASTENKEVIVGSSRLVKSNIFSPPTSPVKPDEAYSPTTDLSEPKEAEGSSIKPEDVFEKSPPLSSTPVNDTWSSPEQGMDAIVQEESNAERRTDLSGERKMSTVMATMWLGTNSGNLYVHSAIGSYSQCLASLKLNDAILAIVPCASRCIVALADATVAIFARSACGQWNFDRHYVLTLGSPNCSVRCLSPVGCTVWCGYRNKVHVIEPRSRIIIHTLEAHPRQESQVRQMAWLGDGVWVSIKMDSTLRLYHAHTYQHLMDVDIEPYVSKMLGTGKLGFSLVRITALLISSGRLWIGTSNGVVISVPLSATSAGSASLPPLSLRGNLPGQPMLVMGARPSSPTGTIPSCSMAHAQLSFHGHRDAVKFFVAVPGAGSPHPSPQRAAAASPTAPAASLAPPPPMLVISGGEGYIDFRIADSEMEESVVVGQEGTEGLGSLAERTSRSHLIVWQVALQ